MMSKASIICGRITGYIIICMIIAIALMFRFDIGETSKFSYYIDIAIISMGGAVLINIFATKAIGKIYDDMKRVKTSQSIVGSKGYTILTFVVVTLIVMGMLKLLIDKNCELNSIVEIVNIVILINIAREWQTLYIGNKYAIIQWSLVKLEDISSVTRNHVTKKSSVIRSEFIVKTKKGKLYTVGCDKDQEISIWKLSKAMGV